jgi:hypothetical protein
MNIEKQLTDILYKKLGGASFNADHLLGDGTLSGVRIKRRQIASAVSNGTFTQLIDLLIADPAMLGRYGTKRIRDGLATIARGNQKDGAQLARTLSKLLRSRESK